MPGGAWRCYLGHWALRGYGNWVIEEKSSGRWIGYAAFGARKAGRSPSSCGALPPTARAAAMPRRRRGCAREFAYRKLGWITLTSYIDPRNSALAACGAATWRHTTSATLNYRDARPASIAIPGPKNFNL